MNGRWAGLATLSGTLYAASFLGESLWPLCLVSLVPLLELVRAAPRRAALWGAAWAGLIASQARGYFLVETLRNFGGLPLVACVVASLALSATQSGQWVLFAWLLRRARALHLSTALLAPLCFAAVEFTYPRLFNDYFANALHGQPLALQVVDFGGPGLLSMVLVLTNVAVHEALAWRRGPRGDGVAMPRSLLACALVWAGVLAYGGYRMGEVDARIAAAPKLGVGLVQINAGMFDKRKKSVHYLGRYRAASIALEKTALLEGAPLDLVVWPETAIKRRSNPTISHRGLRAALLLGMAPKREVAGELQRFNSALLVGDDEALLGTYDKHVLLPFGEYLPFSDRFPALRTWFPRSGHFRAGRGHPLLPLGDVRIAALICYEDVLPGLVRDAMRDGEAHLLVNLTNDAWFGKTHAPYLHFALSKFRAVEHHRFVVRSTNSGVSAVIDPTGRVVAQAPAFEEASLRARVAKMEGQTLYGQLGDLPGWLSLLLTPLLLWRAGRKHPAPQRAVES